MRDSDNSSLEEEFTELSEYDLVGAHISKCGTILFVKAKAHLFMYNLSTPFDIKSRGLENAYSQVSFN